MRSLRRYLERTGRSQTDLARSLGIRSQSVCEWMSGKTQPAVPMLKKLARETGLTTDELLDMPLRRAARDMAIHG